MGAAAAKVALALGIDGVAQWVIRFVVTLLMVSLVVVLIVVQTVASVLTGVGLVSKRELLAVRSP